eukprot:Hpha_TRINITY_DN15550_c6_g9::TRINITY_DN15550_c6_g9_i1::g.104534::m.104534
MAERRRAVSLALLAFGGACGGTTLLKVEPEAIGLGGGVPITIFGQGFSGDPFLGGTEAWVGHPAPVDGSATYRECKLDDAFTQESRIMCEFPPPVDASALSATPLGVQHTYSSSSQRISVRADGRWVQLNAVYISYDPQYTPWLEGISHASFQGARMRVRGRLIARNPAEVVVRIGDSRCSVLDELHDNEIKDVAHEPNDERQWACRAQDQDAGYYSAKVGAEADLLQNDQESPSRQAGYALPSQRDLPDLYKQSPQGEVYMVAHHPIVTSISPAEGSPTGGTLLTLQGSGFVAGKTEVEIDSRPCTITDISADRVLCTTPIQSTYGWIRPGVQTATVTFTIPTRTVDPSKTVPVALATATVPAVTIAPSDAPTTGPSPAATAQPSISTPPPGSPTHAPAPIPATVTVPLNNPDYVPYPMFDSCSCATSGCCTPGGAGALVEEWDLRNGPAGLPEADWFVDEKKDEVIPLGDHEKSVTPGHLTYERTRKADRTRLWRDDLQYSDVLEEGSHFVKEGDRYNGDTEVPSGNKLRNKVKVVSSYFTPPVTSTYTFYLRGNDFATLSALIGGSMEVLATSQDANNHSATAQWWGGAKSRPLELVAGEPLYIEVGHGDHTGPEFFNVAVSHLPTPHAGIQPYHTVPTVFMVDASRTLTSRMRINNVGLSVGPSSDCTRDAAFYVERALGAGAHVVGSGRVENATHCRYFVKVFRPHGYLSLSPRAETSIEVLQWGSNEWFYDPIPLNMLRFPSRREGGVALSVRTNGLEAVPNSLQGTTWRYNANLAVALGSISAGNYRAGELMYIDTTSATQLRVGDAEVKVGGKPCAHEPLEIVGGVVRCVLPALSAGPQVVDVRLGRYGYPSNLPSTGTWPISYEFSVTGFRVLSETGVPSVVLGMSGSLQGGARLTLVGTGFSTTASQNTVTIGGVSATVSLATPTELSIVTPPGAAGTVGVQVSVAGCVGQGCSAPADLSYTYDATLTPTVSTVSWEGQSEAAPNRIPASGGFTLTIQGANFPQSVHTRKVLVCKNASPLECSECVINADTYTATTAECTAPTLTPGGHSLYVTDSDAGGSAAWALETSFRVDSVWPYDISTQGGALLTITGSGFHANNFIMIGPTSEVGLKCVHRTVTDTVVVCQLERNTKQYTGRHLIRLYANEAESHQDGQHAFCGLRSAAGPAPTYSPTTDSPTAAGDTNSPTAPSTPAPTFGATEDTCWANFNEDVTPQVTSKTGAGHNAAVSIVGTGLRGIVEVKAGNAACASFTVTDTQVDCTMGTGVSGTYWFEVTSNEGFARLPPTDSARTQWYDLPATVTSVTPATGSQGGGLTVTFAGFGFKPSETTATINGGECKIVGTIAGESFTCITPVGAAVGTAYDVGVTAGTIQGSGTGLFTYALAETAEITSVSATGTGHTRVVTLTGTRFPTSAFTVAVGTRPCVVRAGSTDTGIVCDVELLAAADLAPVISYASGLSIASSGVSLSIPLDFSTATGAAYTLPFPSGELGGRTLSLTGTGFSSDPTEVAVTVCGHKCTIVSSSPTDVSCLAPRAVSRQSYENFPGQAEIMPLTSSEAQVVPMLDGDAQTWGSMGSTAFTVTMPTTDKAYAKELHFFSADVPTATRAQLRDVTFEVRASSSDPWFVIHTIRQTPRSGWNKIKLPRSVPLVAEMQVRKATGATTSPQLGFTEIRLMGHKVSVLAVEEGRDSVCPVSVSVTVSPDFPAPASAAVTVSLDSFVRYSAPRTPRVHAFEPQYGTAAGGTRLTIIGEALRDTLASPVGSVTQEVVPYVTVTLPTRTSELTLPTATDRITPTATEVVTLPTKTELVTRTIERTVTVTKTFTGVTRTFETTLTLPTGTNTVTLQTQTVVQTVTLPTTTIDTNNPPSLAVITIDGVKCTAATERACSAAEAARVPVGTECSVLECTTVPRPTLPDANKVGVEVRVPQKGYAHLATAAFVYADLWQSALTWRGGIIPRAGDLVALVKGRNIILDRSPLPEGEAFAGIILDGELIFSNDWDESADPSLKEIRLETNLLLIRGGALRIGTEQKPYSRKATITLHGDRHLSIPLPVYGTKNIAVRGGTVQLHGQPKVPTWTRLEATADKDSTSVLLRESTNWVAGDEIVIAPSSFDQLEAEQRTITSVEKTAKGDRLHFDEPLWHEHFGAIETHHGIDVDMSVEVGVLTRSIKVQGDPESWRQKFGAHMIFHSPDRELNARIEYVELRRVGQSKIIGRYPIHFHMEKDRPDVLIKGCAIHNSFNRAVVLHDTSYTQVEHNIAYNGMGHLFFVEDGSERFNTLYKNLGIQAKPTGGQLSHDVFTSVFWGANPQNNFIDNAAAGSSHMGFWISPPKHPRKNSYDETSCPQQVPLGETRGNTAHSSGRMGFWVHPDHFAREIECGPESEAENPYAFSEVHDTRVWKNVEQGIGIVDSGPYLIKNAICIDNSDADIEIGGIVGNQGAIVRDSVFIAHSKTNRPGADWQYLRAGVTGKRGLITPQSEGMYGINLTFIDYNDDQKADSIGKKGWTAAIFTCCRCWNDCSSEMGAFTTRLEQINFINSVNRVRFGWPHKDIILDLDGTVTGTDTTPGVPKSTLIPAYKHVRLPGCEVGGEPHWTARDFRGITGSSRNPLAIIPAMVCPPKYAFHRLIIFKPTPMNQLQYRYSIGSPTGYSTMIYDEAVETRPFTHGWSAIVASADNPSDNVPFRLWYDQFLDWRELYLWVTELPENPFRHPLQLDLNHTNNYLLIQTTTRLMNGQHTRKLAGDEGVQYDSSFEANPQFSQVTMTGPPLPETTQTLEETPTGLPTGTGFVVPPLPYGGAFPGGIPGYRFNGDASTSSVNYDATAKVLSVVLNHQNTDTLSPPFKTATGVGGSHMFQMNPVQCPVSGDGLCITMKPPVDPPEELDWFNPAAWDEGVVPQDGHSVFIRQGRTILLRGKTAKLVRLVIQGTLKFVDDGDAQVELHATYVFVQNGTLQIGTDDLPFDNGKEAHVVLYGDFETPGLGVSNNHWLGAAVLANFGTVQMNGRLSRSWTRLAATANVGATTITVQDTIGTSGDYNSWRVGDKIWISSTSYEADEYEIRGITAVSADGLTITLDQALVNEHLGEVQDIFEMRAKVGLLSRNIKVRAPADRLAHGPKDSRGAPVSYGCHITFSEVSDVAVMKGTGYIKNTEVHASGQFGGDRGALYLDRLHGEAANLINISRVSIWSNNYYGIKVERGNAHIYIEDAVIAWTRAPAVWLERGNTWVKRCLAGGTEQEGDGKPAEIVATYYSKHLNRFHNNVAAGSWETGFAIYSEWCHGRSAENTNRYHIRNEAHSNTIGFWIHGNRWCSELKGNRAWRNSDMGIFAMVKGSFRLTEAVVHDNLQGVNAIITHDTKWKYALIRNSLISGRSTPAADCSKFQCVRWHQDEWRGRAADCHPSPKRYPVRRNLRQQSVGILLSQGRAKAKEVAIKKRSLNIPLPYDNLGSTTPYGVTRVENVTFRNFKNDSCGTGPHSGDAVFMTLEDARSHILPHLVKEAKWENVDDDAKFFYHQPDPAWRNGVECGDGWDCSGLQQTLVSSPDGTLFGSGTPEAVVSQLPGVATPGKCTMQKRWSAFKCLDAPYGELFMQSKDPDSYERRIYPLRIERLNHTGEGKPFFLVNQPPDKYMPSEWPGFSRPSWFWAVMEANRTYKVNFGDLPPRTTYWEYNHCVKNQDKVILSIHYPEPYRLEVWLDPENNETGRTPSSSEMVTMDQAHTTNFYEEGAAARLLHVVVQCGQGFTVRQVLNVRVAMRLEMTVAEFFDQTTTEEFANNLATILGIPSSRIRVVEVRAASTARRGAALQTEKAEVVTEVDAAMSETTTADNMITDLASVTQKLTSTNQATFSSALGIPVASPDTWVESITQPSSVVATCSSDSSNTTTQSTDSSLCETVRNAALGTTTMTATMPSKSQTATLPEATDTSEPTPSQSLPTSSMTPSLPDSTDAPSASPS